MRGDIDSSEGRFTNSREALEQLLDAPYDIARIALISGLAKLLVFVLVGRLARRNSVVTAAGRVVARSPRSVAAKNAMTIDEI